MAEIPIAIGILRGGNQLKRDRSPGVSRLCDSDSGIGLNLVYADPYDALPIVKSPCIVDQHLHQITAIFRVCMGGLDFLGIDRILRGGRF